MSNENTPQEPKDLRDAYERANARAAEAEEAATKAITDLREFKATTLFGNEKHADLFLAKNPEAEITPEVVADFVKDYGLQPASTEPVTPVDPPKEDPGAALGTLGGAAGSAEAGSAPPAQPKMSKEDFEQLLQTNPQAAAEAYVSGIAPRNAQNVTARELVTKGIIDH